jgi:hypothetical protein
MRLPSFAAWATLLCAPATAAPPAEDAVRELTAIADAWDKAIDVYARRGGKWRVVSVQITPIVAAENQ